MGIFYDQVKVSNLAPITLNVRFDGSDMRLPPGDSFVPKPAITFAKNQNPIMGSQSPNNPSVTGAKYLIGVYGTKDRTTPLTKDEWEAHLNSPSRLNVAELANGMLGAKEHFETRGGGPTMARSSWDEGVRVSGANFESGAAD